jgi:hypothetical protein
MTDVRDRFAPDGRNERSSSPFDHVHRAAWELVQMLELHYPELVVDPEWVEVRDLKAALEEYDRDR